MSSTLRVAARAFLLAMLTALAVDAVLATLTGLVTITSASDGTPWWVAAHLVDRGRWVVVAGLLVAIGGRLTALDVPGQPSSAAVWRFVGIAVVTAPLLWIMATWVVQATLFTLARRWDVDGHMFLAAGYYQRLLVGYAPWLLAGATTIAASRHVP